jgi:hypothetical protein
MLTIIARALGARRSAAARQKSAQHGMAVFGQNGFGVELYALDIHCKPKQIPNMGSLPAKHRITSMEMPASVGEHGPGEMQIPRGAFASISCTVMASLRWTSTSAPSCHKYWTTFQVKES